MAFTTEDWNKLAAQVKLSEGLRLQAYKCTAGALTIGWGHNVDVSPIPGVSRVGDKITLEQAESIFERDLCTTIKKVRDNLPWVLNLDAPRQAVLYDMCFQLGLKGMLGFKNTLKRIQTGDYKGAAQGFHMSLWATQTPKRVIRHAKQLETGAWV